MPTRYLIPYQNLQSRLLVKKMSQRLRDKDKNFLLSIVKFLIVQKLRIVHREDI